MAEKVVALTRDSWMPDVKSSACHKCEKNFNWYIRRHHCRYCGLLFCGKCSKINVQLFNNVKLDRTCDKCLAVLQVPESKPSNQLAQYPYFPKDNSVFVDEEVEDATTEPNLDPNIDLQGLFHEAFDGVFETVDQNEFLVSEELDKYLLSRCRQMIADIDYNDYIETLASTIKESISLVKTSKSDKMDISKYLKIIDFPVEDKFKFFRGFALKKHLACKKMIPKLLKPKILLLSGSVGYYLGDKKIVSIDKLIEQEENFSKILLDLVKNIIKPNIIIIEKTMPYLLIEELTSIGVDVIQNVKKRNLKLLARLTDSKILSSINQSLYQSSNYLGNCSEFWQQKIGQSIYCFFQANEVKLTCGTILYNTTKGNKSELKQLIRKLLIQYRSVVLEKSLVSLFEVTKIDYEDFHSSETSFIHLSTARGKMCSRPRIHKIEYYSKNGKSIGDYLKFTLTNVLEKCESFCDKKVLDHKHFYFKGRSAVSITCTISDETFKSLQVYRECKICGCKSQSTKLIELAWKFSFNKFVDNFFSDGQVETDTCVHEFYKEGRFYFGLLNYLVMISLDKYQLFSIKREKNNDNQIIESLLRISKAKTQDFADFLVFDHLAKYKESLFLKSFSAFSDENKPEDGVVLNESIRMIDESFNSVQLCLNQIKRLKERDYLQVEVVKRRVFDLISQLTVDLEAGYEVLENIEKRKGVDSASCGEISNPVINVNGFKSLNCSWNDRVNVMNRPEFQYFRESCPTFKIFSDEFSVPINEDDTLTAIAYALCSDEYQEQLKDEMDDSEDFREKVESELLGAKEDHFKFRQTNYKQDSFGTTAEYDSFRKVYGDSMSIKVVAYFYKQFHGIRSFCLDSHYDFLLSISQSQKEELHLGKSKAYFRNSVDERFIIKIIGERQFRMFVDFAPNYFRHIYKKEFHSMPSCLVKILGAYFVKIKNHSTGKVRKEFILINENLSYSFPKSSLVYDLKGTINKRRKVQEGDERTKMDLNFVEFMKGLPLILGFDDKKRLDAEIWNDTLFLSQQNIVDYSLLLILDVENMVLDYGIIDYMEQYTFERAIESKYKSVVGTELPTIIYPKEYKNRFRQHLIQIYFMSVE